ncbi:MAG: DUF721 domain-containing protein [Legionella sp.]|jgi:hypothetical protein
MRPIKQCLNKQLTELCQQSLELEQLSKTVANLLPPDLSKKCQVGSFNKGCLTISTTDAVWASQLRYLLPELRDKLRSEAGLYQLSSIKIKLITPVFNYEKEKKPVQEKISDKSKANILSESEHCTYLPLKKAWLNLARKLGK